MSINLRVSLGCACRRMEERCLQDRCCCPAALWAELRDCAAQISQDVQCHVRAANAEGRVLQLCGLTRGPLVPCGQQVVCLTCRSLATCRHSLHVHLALASSLGSSSLNTMPRTGGSIITACLHSCCCSSWYRSSWYLVWSIGPLKTRLHASRSM